MFAITAGIVVVGLMLAGMWSKIGGGKPKAAAGSSDDLARNTPMLADMHQGARKIVVDTMEIKQGISEISGAFRTNDPAKATRYLHPNLLASIEKTIVSHGKELFKIADLVDSAVPLVQTPDYCEYEAVQNGRKFTLVFEKSNGKWCLARF